MEKRTIYEVKNSKNETKRYTELIQLKNCGKERTGDIYLAHEEKGIWVLLNNNGDIHEKLGRENLGINTYFKKYEIIFYCRERRIVAIGRKNVNELLIVDDISYDNSRVNYIDKKITLLNYEYNIYIYGKIIMLVEYQNIKIYTSISNKWELLYDLNATDIVIDGERYTEFNIISIKYTTKDEDSTKQSFPKKELFFSSNGNEMEISFIPKKRE